MTQLKLLMISDVELLHGFNCLPTSLKVLHYFGYPLKTLPLNDKKYEVVEIKMRYSKIEQLWHGNTFLGKLKHLDLSHSFEITQTPDLSAVPILETLVLESCWRLYEVHPSVVHHKNLVLLNLRSCSSLETLPDKLEMGSLNELILDHCYRLHNLPEFGECMKSLSRLSLMSTGIRKLPASLECLVGLEDLNFEHCNNLVCLPDAIHGLKCLKILSASACRKFDRLPSFALRIPLMRILDLSYCDLTEESFPPDFGHFPSLMNLDLSGNSFITIPINIHELPKLRSLKLNSCKKLQSLPELPSSIRELEACNCPSLNISEFNTLSNVCSVFVSQSQDHDQVLLQMLIPGSEIPSWFVHRQDDNCVLVPSLHNFPLNERLGIVLCFLIQTFEMPVLGWFSNGPFKFPLVLQNGNRFITNRISPLVEVGYHLYILCLTKDCFSDEFHQGNCFELSVINNPFNILTSGAHWMTVEDVKYLNKSEMERPKKTQKVFDLNKSIEEME